MWICEFCIFRYWLWVFEMCILFYNLYIYIYIYKTETFEATTIFHDSNIYINNNKSFFFHRIQITNPTSLKIHPDVSGNPITCYKLNLPKPNFLLSPTSHPCHTINSSATTIATITHHSHDKTSAQVTEALSSSPNSHKWDALIIF